MGWLFFILAFIMLRGKKYSASSFEKHTSVFLCYDVICKLWQEREFRHMCSSGT
jgi:hypothetical protein